MATKGAHVDIVVDGRTVRVSNPDKVFFPNAARRSSTWSSTTSPSARGALVGRARAADGAEALPERRGGRAVLPEARAGEAAGVAADGDRRVPERRDARGALPNDVAHLVWAVNLGCLDWNPWPVRRADVDHPDELRVDLDPQPGVPFDEVRDVRDGGARGARGARHGRLPEDVGLARHPRQRAHRAALGLHEVRRAALALAREVERRMPGVATSKWWKEERRGRVHRLQPERARPYGRVGLLGASRSPTRACLVPAAWDEVPDVEPADLTLGDGARRGAERGDPARRSTTHALSLDAAARARRARRGRGPRRRAMAAALPQAPGESRRVAPSRKASDPMIRTKTPANRAGWARVACAAGVSSVVIRWTASCAGCVFPSR